MRHNFALRTYSALRHNTRYVKSASPAITTTMGAAESKTKRGIELGTGAKSELNKPQSDTPALPCWQKLVNKNWSRDKCLRPNSIRATFSLRTYNNIKDDTVIAAAKEYTGEMHHRKKHPKIQQSIQRALTKVSQSNVYLSSDQLKLLQY